MVAPRAPPTMAEPSALTATDQPKRPSSAVVSLAVSVALAQPPPEEDVDRPQAVAARHGCPVGARHDRRAVAAQADAMAEQVLAPLVGSLQLGGLGGARPTAAGSDEDIHRPQLGADERLLSSHRYRRAIAAHGHRDAEVVALVAVRGGEPGRLGGILPPACRPDEDISRARAVAVPNFGGEDGSGDHRRAIAAH